MGLARRCISAVCLPPNPVWRSYAGGRVLRAFRGQKGTSDDHFPEDWLASSVCARNGDNAQHASEGLSRIMLGGRDQIVAQCLREDPEFWFGRSGSSPREAKVLWKLLDSSVRLQVQAHPDAAFAREHLRSNAGKTECWYILGTRGESFVYLGFQSPPTRSAWGHMIREQQINEMLACFQPIAVHPGDCYVVPAGTPHAIGAGVFMVEMMEPTDWVVRCETVNAGVCLSPEACFMGLDLETCLDVFDYRAHPLSQVRSRFGQLPRRVRQRESFIEEELISPAWHRYFRLHRLRGTGSGDWPGNELLLLIAVKGAGQLSAQGNPCPVRAGQTWLLPGAAPQWAWRNLKSDWELLLAGLPLPAGSASAETQPQVKGKA